MKNLYLARKHAKDNQKFLDMTSYYLAKREYSTVRYLLNNITHYTKDSNFIHLTRDLFITNPNIREFFGIAENIVGSMANMVFAGNVNIKVEDEKTQELIDELYFDGHLMESIKNAYKDAISMAGYANSYLFFKTIQEYDNKTQVKIKDKFIDFESVPSFLIEKTDNTLVRKYYRTITNDMKEEVREYHYTYVIDKDMNTELFITGFDDNGVKLSDSQVMEDLEIDVVYEYFDFIPFVELKLGQGMLPNILWIESGLAEILYFQDEDLPNSQTTTYVPENQLYEQSLGAHRNTFYDKYETKKVLKGNNIDAVEMVSHVEGKSAISNLEKSLALNVIQASLDAKISPVSLGYSLVDKLASNTDVGVEKERVSIRKRENDVATLKIFISKVVQKHLYLNDIHLDEREIAVLFDQYITPSIESMTNTLAKQVQFGIKSRYRAVVELNKNELSDKEIDEEYERIKEMTTQIDYNVEQRTDKEEPFKKGTEEDTYLNKANTNILKSEK